jgi:hypothetical protein
MQATETHHRVPRHLLSAHDGVGAHSELDSEGIGLALEFEWLGMRHGLADAGDLSREELASRIEASCVELPRGEHRKVHASDWCGWGSWGGKSTLARYGRAYFRHLALRRWGRINAAELARVRDRLRAAREAAA